MEALFGKCGVNCGRCPSYKSNLRTGEDRQRCSDGWGRYLGFTLSPDKLRLCDGCQAPDDENPVRYQNCYVRKCAVRNGAHTCAHCSAYPCEDVPGVSLPADHREKRAAALGISIPEEDYLTFIEPYEGMKHLAQIRASLSPQEIVMMTRVSARPRIVDFPKELPLSKEETSALRALHRILAAIGSSDDVSYAREAALKKRRRHVLKILWAFGLFGRSKEEGGSQLVIDGETYLSQRIHSSYSKLKEYLQALEEHGVQCEHVPLKKEGWLTPRGGLRKQGWSITMSFDDRAGGVWGLKGLQRFAVELKDEYGGGAFRYFSKADMRVLGTSPQSNQAGR